MDSYTIISATVSTKSYTPSADVRLIGVQSLSNGVAVVSWDPSVSQAGFSGPLADSTDTNVISFVPLNSVLLNLPTPVPIEGGRSIFVAFSSKGSVTLFFTPS